jgi:3-oxoacyl-[acyl-carrier protein] reductase
LITGGTSGIGASAARLLAAEGASVWVTYASDQAGADATVAACRSAGAEARASHLDQRAPESIDALVAEVATEWGSLHALVNNGGVCPWTRWDEIGIDEWDWVLEVNARGPFLLTQAFVPLMRAADGDRAIVNVASVAGQTGGVATSLHYAASKGALLAMTRSLARLLAPERIRANAVCPGPVTTPIFDDLAQEARDRLAAGLPLQRFGEPDEVGHVVALLASDRSTFTTGASYDVNGGLLMD